MSWVSLNDVYINKSGGAVSGNLSVGGALTIDSGKGDGSTYNVASQITSLNSGKAAVSHTHAPSAIVADGKSTISLDALATLPTSKGGTGATTAAAALTNLGAASASALKTLQDSVSLSSMKEATRNTSATGTDSSLHYINFGKVVWYFYWLRPTSKIVAWTDSANLFTGLPIPATASQNSGIGLTDDSPAKVANTKVSSSGAFLIMPRGDTLSAGVAITGSGMYLAK